MKKHIVWFILLFSIHANAGKRMFIESNPHERAGVLRFQGTLGIGYMTQFKALHISLHGDLEYFINERISVRNDIYYSLAVKNNDPVSPFKMNHNLFTGIGYHFTPGRAIDFYAGFQPGVALCQRKYIQFETLGLPSQLPDISVNVNPVISINTGLTYYGNRFFHAFVHLKYLTGLHQDNYTSASLDELRISFGLGFHIQTKKKNVKNA